MFTQPCFIRKNSEEIAKKLQDIGYYTYNTEDYKEDPSEWNTVTEIEANYAGIWNNEPKGEAAKRRIDCGTNEDLFLALAALRDDTDKNQWFVYDDKDDNPDERQIFWFICEEDKIEDDMWHDQAYLDCHKATVEELIQHFKNK